MSIRYLDLFSGIGGFRQALLEECKIFGLNSECVGSSDIDSNCVKTYNSNFKKDKHEVEFGNIANITGLKFKSIKFRASKKVDKHIDDMLPNFNMLFAGFPCQSFSLMGKKNGFMDERGTLFFHIAHILSAKKPEFFILENVRGLMTNNDGRTFKEIKYILEKKLGYYIVDFVLNSRDYGIPQNRRRLYILGFSSKRIGIKSSPPAMVDLEKTDNPTTWHLLEERVDERYYLSKKILKTILSNGTGGYKYKSEINPLIARPLCATMHKMHRACQDNYFSESFVCGNYNKKKGMIVLCKNSKEKVRRITPTEAFRLQGFPDKFISNARKVGVSDTQLYKQSGNAVNVATVKQILEHVFNNTTLISEIN
jgi:DNA (cytosine-5)-methyltransferase 1